MSEINEMKNKSLMFIKKYMNLKYCAVILIIGVLFMCIGQDGQDTKKKIDQSITEEAFFTEYKEQTQMHLAKILSTISGVKDVSVMITYKDSGINQYEKNKTLREKESEQELSLKSEGTGKEEPVLVKKSFPTVLGVIVTAQGADNPEVNSKIISAVKAVLDVSAHRISVLSK